jgi:acetyl-CoA synthase
VSKIIYDIAINGAAELVARAEVKLAEAIRITGEASPVGFPDTAYYLPVIYSFTGKKVKTLTDLAEILLLARQLLPNRPANPVWFPYLGQALDAGVASLFAAEISEACKYLVGPSPVADIWLGAANDVIMRERGIEFVDGTAPGFAAITGAAPTNEIAVKIARELQQKNLYVFMAGSTHGRQFAEQLADSGVQLGWETRLIPFGKDVPALIYGLGFANRAALSFGGIQPGDFTANLKYNQDRIFAFVLALGEVTPAQCAIAAGAMNYGFPVIADTNIPQILPSGVCTYEHVVANIPYETMVERALEVRGCKIKVDQVPIPVPYGPAFEGERIRKADVRVEFGGNKTVAFEFVTMVNLDEITDGEIVIIGPDVDQTVEGSALPLAIWVEVAGRKMQSDFEPILERQIHHLLNGAEGIWHMGQRDLVWTRISRAGFGKGLRLRHYGEILHAKLLSEYPAIVDKVKVTVITDQDEVEKRIQVARKIYDERNRRLEAMTDESVDTFYSCLLCQSFAPNHVCMITPERLGLCGAYNWLDGKAAYEIDETGPNQPVKKGECLDPIKGVWKGINDYVYINSHKTVSSLSAYSIMDYPMTSCGCFEAICAYVPECNGVMVVNREYQGDTPVGMTFSTLAGNVGGGQQTPGFMGCGKVYLTSRKFLFGEGGFRRLVWMPKELKKLLSADLQLRFEEQQIPGLLEQIADETIAVDVNSLRAFIEKVNHPALSMQDMTSFATLEPVCRESSKKITSSAGLEPENVTAANEVVANQATARLTLEAIAQMKEQLINELKESITKDVVHEIIGTLSRKFLGGQVTTVTTETKAEKRDITGLIDPVPGLKSYVPSIAAKLEQITAFKIHKESHEVPVWTVKLGATIKEGGTRGRAYTVGGATCMPFHLWEGIMPNRPLVAMEVFDVISLKYPDPLKNSYADLLKNPVQMAKVCVEKYNTDLISVRLEGTHPEKGGRSPAQSVELVKSILAAVDVPLIITGHNHFESNNEVMKAVAQACAGENLLLNWVEPDNYRTIAGAALAYGHSVVAQSPIDLNIGKQLNILLTNLDIRPEQIIMDPMTGVVGYGIEYTYSVMERIRLTGLNGDKMLAGPMIATPGQECVKIKEFKASEASYPAWGNPAKRAVMWELVTAMSLLYAGADILIMYHPEAAMALKRNIFRLMDIK